MNTEMIVASTRQDSAEAVLDSREVAKMVEKEHAKLLKDIRRYSEQLAEAKIDFYSYWEKSEYSRDDGRKYPCYLITKKGCEFIAHKMTGTKGTVFTARYIERFHEMENTLQAAPVSEQVLEFMRGQLEINREQQKFNETLMQHCKDIIGILGEQKAIPERTATGSDWLEDDSNPFETENPLMEAIREDRCKSRLKILNRQITKCAELSDIPVNNVYHYLYQAIQKSLYVDLRVLMDIYQEQTGTKSTSPIHVIAANQTLFDYAEGLIGKVLGQAYELNA